MRSTVKVVTVTGAAGGMGCALCRSFAHDGASVGMVDRDGGRLEELAGELRQGGAQCEYVAADVGDRDQVLRALHRINDSLGPTDILITAAGICRASTVDDLRIAELEEVVRVNFFGMVYAIEATLPSMLERGQGQIVGFSSMAAVRGIPFESAYAAAKAGATVYLESLRTELRWRGITVTLLYPGYVKTGLLDDINAAMGADMSEGRALQPEVAAAKIKRAILGRRSKLYFPVGLGLAVRLSLLLPPRLYDRVMGRMFKRFPISRPAEIRQPR